MTTKELHHRSFHNSPYDFSELIKAKPELEKHIIESKTGEVSINFFKPESVKVLNQALLKHFYNIEYWDLPQGCLIPPIPGRADYIHHIAELLNYPSGEKFTCLDIGVGANCIYPIIGTSVYGWSFIGSDTETTSLENAQKIIDANSNLKNIYLRKQNNHNSIFEGIIGPHEHINLAICNPPFHKSAEAAAASSERKISKLKGRKITDEERVLNFSGSSNELWCEGGEIKFIAKMIEESVRFRRNIDTFSTLVSKEDSLRPLLRCLKKARVSDYRIIEMKHGNKKSRILAWTF